jgi:hypothetical protein
MHSRSWILVFPVLSLSTAAFARSTNHFELVASQFDYSVAPGGTVDVPLYIHQLNGDAPNITVDGGLYSVCIAISRSVAIPTSPAFLSSLNPDTTDFAVTNPLTDYVFSSTSAGFVENRSSFLTSTGPVPDINGLLYIGKVSVTAGNVPGQTTAFNLRDFDLTTDQTQTYANHFLDSGITAGVFSVTVGVPEPSTLSAFALLASAFLLRRRRS